jgi:hypothetical protein
MSVSKDAVLVRLKGILGPDLESDIVSLGLVSDIFIADAKVFYPADAASDEFSWQVGDTAEAFEMSYLENALTSNPTLSKLATRSQKDVYAIIAFRQESGTEKLLFEFNKRDLAIEGQYKVPANCLLEVYFDVPEDVILEEVHFTSNIIY